MIDIDEMAAGYIEAALWADCEPLPAPCTCGTEIGQHAGGCMYGMEESGNLQHLDVSELDRQYVRELCAAFVAAAGDDLQTFATYRSFDPSQGTISHYIGHDLRLTSGGHGTGFWDRECSEWHAETQAVFNAAARHLSDLASSRPFSRTGGGDCWQVDEASATFDRWSLDPNAAPGARWEGEARA